MAKRIAAIVFIFVCTSVAWVFLGGTMMYRTEEQDQVLKNNVQSLWGQTQRQQAPSVVYQETENRKVLITQDEKSFTETQEYINSIPVPIESSRVDVSLDLEHRQKGLLWYSTYRVKFSGKYGFTNPLSTPRAFQVQYDFPSADGIYDDFRVEVNGKPVEGIEPEAGGITLKLDLEPAESAIVAISYASQGMDEWWYEFGKNIKQVRDFELNMTTNFTDVNFPEDGMSPTTKSESSGGWKLNWKYSNLLSGAQIGMQMPQKINPGPFVARVSFFAPVSLFLFFFLIVIISTLRGIKIHPMNYFFLAAAFFSFHLLMAYLVDHIDIALAFAISSLVSIGLVLSYMRIVVGARFALVETGLSQLIYLVLFSYAFFLEGYTGLAITVTCIVTLFIVMMATAKVDWGEVFRTGDNSVKKGS